MKLKDILEFFIVCYIACLLTKIAMNRLTFDIKFLIDSLVITFGATIGWFTCTYFQNKRKNK